MGPMTFVLSAALAQVAAPAASQAASAPRADDWKTDRKIGKQPAWVAAPKFARFVLDEAGAFRCWAAFDKSTPDAKFYDVLYFDRDGNGDLTDPGEKIVGKHDAGGIAAGLEMSFRMKELPVPGTSPGAPIVHRDWLFSTAPKEGRSGFWFQFKWNGGTEFSGGYYPKGHDTTTWGDSIETAPIFRATPAGPFEFALWEDANLSLPANAPSHLAAMVGVRGVGEGTLTVVDEHFLDLEKDALIVTVIGRDASGKEVRTENRLKEHC